MDAPSSKPVNYLRRGWAEAPRQKQLTPDQDQWRTLRRQLSFIDEKLSQLRIAEHEAAPLTPW